jgi:superfamily II DNA or RNA helicase
MPSRPDISALATANSHTELLHHARRLRLHAALQQPFETVLASPSLPPRLKPFLEPLAHAYAVRTLEQFLDSVELYRGLKPALFGDDRRVLLRIVRALLESPVAAPVDDPRGDGGLPDDRAALRAWAKAQRIPDALMQPIEVLAQDAAQPLAAVVSVFGNFHTLEDVVTGGVYISHYDRRSAAGLDQLRPFAVAYLRREAEQAKTSAALARPLPPLDAGRASLQPLLERLFAARTRLLEHVAPMTVEERSRADLHWFQHPLAVRYTHGTRTMSRGAGISRPQAVIELEGWARREALTVSCSCDTAWAVACRHRLAAIDALVDWVHETPPPEALQAFIAEVTAPEWSRTLSMLVRAKAADPVAGWDPAGRLIWRLTQKHGDFTLRPYFQRPAKRGGFLSGELVNFAELAASSSSRVSSADRLAASLLASSQAVSETVVAALRILAASRRVFFEKNSEAPLRITEAGLELVCQEVTGGYRLAPAVEGRPLAASWLSELRYRKSLAEPQLHVDAESRDCFIVQISEAVRTMLGVLEHRGDVFPPEAGDQLVDQIDRSGVRLTLPASLLGDPVPAQAACSVFLSPIEGTAFHVELRVCPHPGGLPFPIGAGPEIVRSVAGERRTWAQRTFGEERAAAAKLWTELGLAPGADTFETQVEGEPALALLRRLEGLAAQGLEVAWPPQRPKLSRPAVATDLSLAISKGRDWFGLSGLATIDGAQVELARLLEAARKKRRFVQVKDDHFVELSEQLQAQLAPLADVVFEGKNGPEVSLATTGIVEALAHEVERFEADTSFTAFSRRLKEAGEVHAAVPKGLKAELRPYQREGFEWLVRCAAWSTGACLADDMGLGKTLQALALLLQRKALGPALVIAPTSVCFNWRLEAEKFAPSLNVISYHQADRERALERLEPGDVLVTSYGLLTSDAERFQKVAFATAVIDEAQAVKNAATQRARAVRELDAQFRVALTGTPMENHLGELWSLFRCLVPGLFGSEEQYRERFWGPVERDRDPSRRRALSQLVRPFLLRRTKAEVARELPPRTEIDVSVELSGPERKLYEEARLSIVAGLAEPSEGPQDKRFQVLAGLTRLRLLSCHPALHDVSWSGPASKLERLLELVDELREEGHRALIFSQFTKHLGVVRKALEERGIKLQYLDGQTPEASRRARVEAFQAGSGDVFLISLKAGGSGLNLTGADNVIHLDPWWNPAVEDQATDRAHRIGQTRAVTVYRLVTRGTIEEAILKLHADKRGLIAGVLEGSGAAAAMKTDELIALLDASIAGEKPGPRRAERASKRAPLASRPAD